MATYLTLLILLMGLILSATAADSPSGTEDLAVAIEEMQKANYFSFVMLIKMSPPDIIPSNITFLMPNDRMLSNISLPENAISEFLLRHSIPSPLLFDHLKNFPTGSMIPTSKPDFMLRVSNGGRRSFYLNNIQIISPNICTAGSSIRCHGIKGVLMTTEAENNITLPSPTCSSTTPPWPSPPLPPVDSLNLTHMFARPPVNRGIRSHKSGSSQLLAGGLFHSITPCMILLMMAFQIYRGNFT